MRRDFESWSNEAVPERAPYWTHTLEGDDDMPAHIKAALFGPTLTLPISHGRLALGTWQGIYLCEHRDRGGPRTLVATAWGRRRAASARLSGWVPESMAALESRRKRPSSSRS